MGLVNGKWYAKTICTLGVHVLNLAARLLKLKTCLMNKTSSDWDEMCIGELTSLRGTVSCEIM